MKLRFFASAIGMAASLFWISSASATIMACPSTPACTLDGQTFTLGTALGGIDPAVNPDAGTTVFLANFTTSSQSNGTIAALVEDFLAVEGIATGVNYLGRQDGSGALGGTSIVTGTGTSGTWTFDPGSTGEVAGFFAIHAGGGQLDSLFALIIPANTGPWNTAENDGHGLSNFDLFDTGGSIIVECLPGIECVNVPEPLSLSIFGAGLAGAAALRRRRKRSA